MALLLAACNTAAPGQPGPALPLIEAPQAALAPLLPRPDLGIYTPLAPESAELAELTRGLCQRDVDVMEDRARCMVCPEQTGRAGQRAGELSARQEGTRALVTLTGCEDEARGFGGGTFSMRRAPDGWHVIDYWPQVLTQRCEATPYIGKPALWCVGDSTWEGITRQQLWLIELEPGRDPDALWAPAVTCDVASCAAGVLECWEEGRWGQADVNEDMMPDVVWEGAYSRWTPRLDAEADAAPAACPPREAPAYTVHEARVRRAWTHEPGGWQER